MAHDDFIHLCGYFHIIGDDKVSLKKDMEDQQVKYTGGRDNGCLWPNSLEQKH